VSGALLDTSNLIKKAKKAARMFFWWWFWLTLITGVGAIGLTIALFTKDELGFSFFLVWAVFAASAAWLVTLPSRAYAAIKGGLK
jgi:hypothetical protein